MLPSALRTRQMRKNLSPTPSKFLSWLEFWRRDQLLILSYVVFNVATCRNTTRNERSVTGYGWKRIYNRVSQQKKAGKQNIKYSEQLKLAKSVINNLERKLGEVENSNKQMKQELKLLGSCTENRSYYIKNTDQEIDRTPSQLGIRSLTTTQMNFVPSRTKHDQWKLTYLETECIILRWMFSDTEQHYPRSMGLNRTQFFTVITTLLLLFHNLSFYTPCITLSRELCAVTRVREGKVWKKKKC